MQSFLKSTPFFGQPKRAGISGCGFGKELTITHHKNSMLQNVTQVPGLGWIL
jgi:hypothetical protein